MNDSVVEWNKTCSTCNSRFVDRMSKPFRKRVRDFKVSHGTCKECREKRNAEFAKQSEAANLYWTFDTVKEYFENHPPFEGQQLLIHDTSWNGSNTYALVTVKVASSGKQKRIIVENYTNGYSGKSFYRSGKNCWAPTGQVRLLPYHPTIGSLIQNNSRNEISLSSKEIYDLIGEK